MNVPLGSPARCLAVWLAASAALGGLAGWLLPDLAAAHHAAATSGLSGAPFDRLLEWLCAAAAVAGCGWLWIVTTQVTLEAARGGSPDRVRGLPAPLRRLLLAACGVALTGGLAAPALATPGEPHLDRSGQVGAALVQGLPLPDRAPGRVVDRSVAAPSHGAATHGATDLVVRPGDTLWDLAGQGLAWHRLYTLNRDVIGPDPDLILPGQVLRRPQP